MQTHAAAVAELPNPPRIAATFDLTDPAERRTYDMIQRFYGPDGLDRLHAVRRAALTTKNSHRRLVWTLGSFRPQRKGAQVEWLVAVWDVDEVSIRFHRCKDAATARGIFRLSTQPSPRWQGVKLLEPQQASAKRGAKPK